MKSREQEVKGPFVRDANIGARTPQGELLGAERRCGECVCGGAGTYKHKAPSPWSTGRGNPGAPRPRGGLQRLFWKTSRLQGHVWGQKLSLGTRANQKQENRKSGPGWLLPGQRRVPRCLAPSAGGAPGSGLGTAARLGARAGDEGGSCTGGSGRAARVPVPVGRGMGGLGARVGGVRLPGAPPRREDPTARSPPASLARPPLTCGPRAAAAAGSAAGPRPSTVTATSGAL